MKDIVSRRPAVPASFLGKLLLPFAVPILLTLALLLLVGDRWPRDIAPGSGLKLAGLCASALVAFAVWRFVVRDVTDKRARKFAALLCALTGLMGWPVWSVGVLPSLNGSNLSGERTVRMALERIEATRKSKSRGYYHWAWLKADSDNFGVRSGRYFISEGIYDLWGREAPAMVDVTVAQGALGALVVTGFR